LLAENRPSHHFFVGILLSLHHFMPFTNKRTQLRRYEISPHSPHTGIHHPGLLACQLFLLALSLDKMEKLVTHWEIFSHISLSCSNNSMSGGDQHV
jgi:hypothetical protein